METHGTTREESMTMSAIQSMNHKMPEITLRDFFASQVMGVFAGGMWNGTVLSQCDDDRYGTVMKLAENAYKIADAMLEARKS